MHFAALFCLQTADLFVEFEVPNLNMNPNPITPEKLEGTINRIFGDFNDEKRNAANLKDYLTVGQEVRMNRNGPAWQPGKITKVGKKSFSVAVGRATEIEFIVVKNGHIYQKGTTNEMSRFHWQVRFDCERIDKQNEARLQSSERSVKAIELGHQIRGRINDLVPFSSEYGITEENMKKLEQIMAIIESPNRVIA